MLCIGKRVAQLRYRDNERPLFMDSVVEIVGIKLGVQIHVLIWVLDIAAVFLRGLNMAGIFLGISTLI